MRVRNMNLLKYEKKTFCELKYLKMAKLSTSHSEGRKNQNGRDTALNVSHIQSLLGRIQS